MGKTEDEVRDIAKTILGFDKIENGVQQGVGQLTTFKQLGFEGIKDKPDGWYLPNNTNEVAIVLDTMAENKKITTKSYLDKILRYSDILLTKYKKVIAILWNGTDIKVFKNKEEIEVAKELQYKQYYINLFKNNYIDKNKIYTITKKINNSLHINFGMENLYHRMIFTACALVAERFGGNLKNNKNNSFASFSSDIVFILNEAKKNNMNENSKIETLIEVYKEIKMNSIENKDYLNLFIDDIIEINESVNSDNWNGEDVMGIFFNEFNRYKGKSEKGQIFTPEHITSFIYDLLKVSYKDKVLDATCGSGGFLVKAMSKMLKEVGGINTEEAKKIKEERLYGIEFDRQIFALACANMLIHKDGRSNLEQKDTRNDEACIWIAKQNITKVLMNPPYERTYGCKKIVENVLNSVKRTKKVINQETGKEEEVQVEVKCAFILPDKKIEKEMKNLLENHTLEMIIKLPEKLFDEGVTTSIFVFKAGVPQIDPKTKKMEEIFAFYIEDDGLERVKNQGRQDIKGKWEEISKYWLDVAKKKVDSKYNTHQWLNPNEFLSYQMPKKEFELYEEDFVKTIFNYTMFEKNINVKELKEKYTENTLYSLNGEKNENDKNN